MKWTAPEGIFDEISMNFLTFLVLKGGATTIKNDVWSFGITMWEIITFGQGEVSVSCTFDNN